MIKEIFSIRDGKSELYGQPFFQNTEAEASRNLARLTQDPSSLISSYPEDFDLYKIGQYDDSTGTLIGYDTPQHIVKAAHLKTQQA